MPSILSETDKETVRRTVPKASNKIQAVAVARLYVAHPHRNRWTYTGLQGAVVLSNDKVGNTFWIKLVDLSPSNRGVIWDQEIYDPFQYNQDRTFFHSFELEQCLAGLSFMDEKEARQFKKKMDEREKNATRETKAQPFASAIGGGQIHVSGSSHRHHSRVGQFFSRHRNSSAPQQPQQITPQPLYSPGPAPASRPQSAGGIDLTDPAMKQVLDEVLQMGITEDQIAENADFIRAYVRQKQTEEMASGIVSALPSVGETRSRAPPPPPPAAVPARISPENTGTSGRRGPPPAPPPSRRPVGGRAPSPPRSASPPARTPSPPATPQPRFRAPPPLADAGKFAVKEGPALHPSGRDAGRNRASSASLANPGPPPPPRPPKTPMEEEQPQGGVFRVPPPFTGDRKSSAPPPPPSRGPVPPPPPSRDTPNAFTGPPPPLPPKTNQTPSHSALFVPQPPPPPPARNNVSPVPPPRAVPPPPAPPPPMPSSSGPPPPPMPSFGSPPPPPPMPSFGGPPPPLSVPTTGGPPPPPPLPSSSDPTPPPLPDVGGDNRDSLLAAIRGTGGGGLRKVKETEKRDRSGAAVPGGASAVPPPGGSESPATPAGDQGGLAGALAAALSQRKKKVSGSGKSTVPGNFHCLCEYILIWLLQMMRRMKMTIGRQFASWRTALVHHSGCSKKKFGSETGKARTDSNRRLR